MNNQDFQNGQFTIQESAGKIPAGMYHGTFMGISKPKEYEHGMSIQWHFKLDSGQKLLGFTSCDNPPTTQNKLGRWLSAISGKPLAGDTVVSPADYAGNRYVLSVIASGHDKTKLDTFPPMST